jgi:hypothetical protein
MGRLIRTGPSSKPCRSGFHRSGGKCVQNVSPSRSQHFGYLEEIHSVHPSELPPGREMDLRRPVYKDGGKIENKNR